MKIHTKADRRERIHLRQRKRITGTTERPRLSVFRSVSHIYAQVIDDLSGKTLASASSTDPKLKGAFAKDVRGGNIKGAEAIGKGHRRAIDRQGHQARGLRPRREPVSRADLRCRGCRAQSRSGVLKCSVVNDSIRRSSTSRTPSSRSTA
jgi:large subunit ribosomal protein L18